MRPAIPLLSLAIALAACTPSNPPAETPPPAGVAAAPATRAVDAQALAASHWRLADAVDAGGRRIDALFPAPDQPLQLDFADGRVSVSGGCNQMSGGYTLSGDRFEVGALAQTKKFCGGGALMAADDAIGARLAGAGTLATGDDGRLVLTTAGGDRLTFAGTPTAETTYGGEGERVFLEVAAERVPCHHPMMPDYRCLHVREITYDDKGIKQETGEWEYLYQDIEGYTHEPGVRNVLRLKRFEVANPPADGSSIAYVLDMVVESESVNPGA
ncbi:DUF4377 domain-containing protein [Luteimonas marina]|uniref:DUF4377 domain-containing protein n=1 Tax=Luteimonas marina TaxID=488485 RepID=A0A5C5TYT5_9GAMM|nr:META and DUF4377 domain-containing protein [Luteimonas marina]TWT19321.1 DUF4377 domain-containing protein [Luteimonas marina]